MKISEIKAVLTDSSYAIESKSEAISLYPQVRTTLLEMENQFFSGVNSPLF